MPLYEYYCNTCNLNFSAFKHFAEYKKPSGCPRCGLMCPKTISLPSLQTDTNFGYTGKIDKRLGGRPVEGRKDWLDRMKEKGFEPITQRDADKMIVEESGTKYANI